MLREAEESLRRLQNETKSCEVIQRGARSPPTRS